MESTEELHAKILTFLSEEFNRKNNEACTKLELFYSPKDFKAERLQTWLRETDPETFTDIVKITNLATTVIERSEEQADSFEIGRHRFTLRTAQYAGGRRSFPFAVSTSARDTGGELVAPVGGVGAPYGDVGDQVVAILSSNNKDLMRVNTQMFGTAFQTLGNINMGLQERVGYLEKENAGLRTKLEAAESTREFKQLEAVIQSEKHERAGKMLDNVLQFGAIMGAKVAGLNDENAPTGLHYLCGKFGESLSAEQGVGLMQLLTAPQRLMFMEIMEAVQKAATHVKDKADAITKKTTGQ